MDCNLPGSSVHGDSPGKNTGIGCHALLQGIFPTQKSNQGPLHCRQLLYQLNHQGRIQKCKWKAKWKEYKNETWSLTSRNDFTKETRHIQVRIQLAIDRQNIIKNMGYREVVQGEIVGTADLFTLWPSLPIPTVGKNTAPNWQRCAEIAALLLVLGSWIATVVCTCDGLLCHKKYTRQHA